MIIRIRHKAVKLVFWVEVMGTATSLGVPALQATASNPRHISDQEKTLPHGEGFFLVEVAGFEPAAFWSRTLESIAQKHSICPDF